VSADRDVTRIVRSWLHEDAHEDADRILNLVLDEIDTTPQRRAGRLARRFPPMSTYARFGLVAAAMVLATAVGIGLVARSGIGGPQASPSPSPVPQIDGTYVTSFSLADLAGSPLLGDPSEVSDENWGDWTLTFRDGHVSYVQRNSVIGISSSSGTFTVNGDAVTMAFKLGANAGETFAYRWHIAGKVLTFTRDQTLGLAPTPFLVKPWSRQ
jgi:hypothetical protein